MPAGRLVSPDPVSVTVPPVALIVPLPQAGIPAKLKLFVPKLNVPLVNAKLPDSVIVLFAATPFVLLTVRLFNCVTPEGINTLADEPPKIRFDVAVVVKFAWVPLIAAPFNVKVFAPTEKVFAPYVRVPLMVRSAPNVKFLLDVKLFNPPEIAFKGLIAVPVPIVRLEVEPPVSVPPA